MHQSRDSKCPPSLPKDFYWYGQKRSKPGRPTKLVHKQIEVIDAEMRQSSVCDNTLTEGTTEGQMESEISDATLNILLTPNTSELNNHLEFLDVDKSDEKGQSSSGTI